MSMQFIYTIPQKYYASDITTVKVLQILGGEKKCIADISDSSSEFDYRETNIRYSDGEIIFNAVYDILCEHLIYSYRDKENNIIARIHFLEKSNMAYIEYEGQFISLECDNYGSPLQPPRLSFVTSRGGVCPIIKFNQIGTLGGTVQYIITVEGKLPTQLLMVIFSLPFTSFCPR